MCIISFFSTGKEKIKELLGFPTFPMNWHAAEQEKDDRDLIHESIKKKI